MKYFTNGKLLCYYIHSTFLTAKGDNDEMEDSIMPNTISNYRLETRGEGYFLERSNYVMSSYAYTKELLV